MGALVHVLDGEGAVVIAVAGGVHVVLAAPRVLRLALHDADAVHGAIVRCGMQGSEAEHAVVRVHLCAPDERRMRLHPRVRVTVLGTDDGDGLAHLHAPHKVQEARAVAAQVDAAVRLVLLLLRLEHVVLEALPARVVHVPRLHVHAVGVEGLPLALLLHAHVHDERHRRDEHEAHELADRGADSRALALLHGLLLEPIQERVHMRRALGQLRARGRRTRRATPPAKHGRHIRPTKHFTPLPIPPMAFSKEGRCAFWTSSSSAVSSEARETQDVMKGLRTSKMGMLRLSAPVLLR